MKKSYILSVVLLMSSFSVFAMEPQGNGRDLSVVAPDEYCSTKTTSSLRDFLLWACAMQDTTRAPALVPDVTNIILYMSRFLKECDICFEVKTPAEFMEMSCCDSGFCKVCLVDGISNALDEHSTRNLRCPNRNCLKQLTEPTIQAITINNKAMYDRYQGVSLDEYLAANGQVQQCPTPDCPARFIADVVNEIVICQGCHQSYCSHCLFDHRGMTCQQAGVMQHNCPDCANRHARNMTCYDAYMHMHGNMR